MKPQSARNFVLCSLILGAVHFAVALLFGYLVPGSRDGEREYGDS